MPKRFHWLCEIVWFGLVAIVSSRFHLWFDHGVFFSLRCLSTVNFKWYSIHVCSFCSFRKVFCSSSLAHQLYAPMRFFHVPNYCYLFTHKTFLHNNKLWSFHIFIRVWILNSDNNRLQHICVSNKMLNMELLVVSWT